MRCALVQHEQQFEMILIHFGRTYGWVLASDSLEGVIFMFFFSSQRITGHFAILT